MPEDQDTGVVEDTKPETEASEVIGTEVDESTEPSENTEADAQADKPEQDKVDRAEYEAAKKEADKLRMELNMRRKKEKESELKRLEDTEEWKSAYETLKVELDTIQADKEREEQKEEIERIRDEILSKYPDKVQNVAKDLGLYWDEAETESDAEAQLTAKVDRIAEALKITEASEEDEDPLVHANNPKTQKGEDWANMDVDEMRKVFPKADPR